jgi:hypothetical protein
MTLWLYTNPTNCPTCGPALVVKVGEHEYACVNHDPQKMWRAVRYRIEVKK